MPPKYMVMLDGAVMSTHEDLGAASQEASRVYGLFAKQGQTIYVKDTNGTTCQEIKKY